MSLKDVDKAALDLVLFPILHPLATIVAIIDFGATIIGGLLHGIAVCFMAAWWLISELWPLWVILLMGYGIYNLFW